MAEQQSAEQAGPEATIVTIPEVLIVFEEYIRRNRQSDNEYQPNQQLMQAVEYCRHVAATTSGNRESVTKMREVLVQRHNFTATEAAAVINLCVSSAEEARKLIPTLNDPQDRFTDEELDRILAEVATFRDLA